MKLRRVSTYPAFYYICLHCGEKYITYARPAYAELDGPPWQAYYCDKCVTMGLVGTNEEYNEMLKSQKEEVKHGI